ncbi:MAG: hypothetical protein HKO65_07575 [Gemmatimonadetes bacterium]|nr:hypothetical protein [Gemmatimonadota bacterium]NNM04949.1 hypothetical protein [Gemmatimonadota bacterium]
MDPIREGIIQIADNVSAGLQNACQTFGFLPDGRELVDMSETDHGLKVAFSDRSEEGWPGFTVNLPAEALFSHAWIGFLARRAAWTVRQAPKAVVDHLSAYNEGFPAPGRRSYRGWTFLLDDGVEIGVGGARDGIVFLAVKQTREPESIGDAIKARNSRYKERWGDLWK